LLERLEHWRHVGGGTRGGGDPHRLDSQQPDRAIVAKRDAGQAAPTWVHTVLHRMKTHGGRGVTDIIRVCVPLHEYAFSFMQCFFLSFFKAIHARSLVPCQDTPSIKFKYTSSVTVPSPLVALMSAIPTGEPNIVDNSSNQYYIHQDIPIPSYLLALACGLLEKRNIGPRSAVWAEKEIVDEATSEFVDTEKFLKTGEDLTVPYVWGRYDILVLPRNFPYGGMENPCLTFVTPTIISGDRSLVNVIAHEIAHSWMGNLVTPKNWQHFWLNEGFTVFLERKIIGRLQGEQMAQFKAILGWEELEKSVKLYGETHQFTNLVPNLEGEDPDDAFSSIPYEKGFNFLYYLQNVVGGPGAFEPYIKAHVKKFQYSSITSEDFKEYFLEHFGDLKKKGTLDQIDWKSWFSAPGFPPVNPNFDMTLADTCAALAEKWQKSKNISDFKKDEYTRLSPEQKVVFLTHLGSGTPLPSETISQMDSLYSVTQETNNEIKFRWQMTALLADYQPILEHVVQFLGSQGRMKYIRPLYRTLASKHRNLAVETFLKNKKFYHPIATKQLTSDLQL